MVHRRRQHTQGNKESNYNVDALVVTVRIGRHAVVDDRCHLPDGGAHSQQTRSFFSRVAVALAGRDYFTVVGMLSQVNASLACDVQTGHLSQVWAWKEFKQHMCYKKMRNLDPVHAFRYYRSGGIYVQWKQWCTDESWSTPILLVQEADMESVASFRPSNHDMVFSAAQSILDWIDRFEVWCMSQPVGTYRGYDNEFRWLRAIVNHQVPGEYSPGTTVDTLLQDLKALPHARPQGPRELRSGFQSDTITQLFPGADIPPIPAENLMKIDGITHTAGGLPIRSNVIHPGSLLLVRVPEDTHVQGTPVKFLVAVAVETNARMARDQHTVVVWYVPDKAPVENFRGGATKTDSRHLRTLEEHTQIDCADHQKVPLATARGSIISDFAMQL